MIHMVELDFNPAQSIKTHASFQEGKFRRNRLFVNWTKVQPYNIGRGLRLFFLSEFKIQEE